MNEIKITLLKESSIEIGETFRNVDVVDLLSLEPDVVNVAIASSKKGWIVFLRKDIPLSARFFQILREDIDAFYEVCGSERYVFVANPNSDVKNNDPSRFIAPPSSIEFATIAIPIDIMQYTNGFAVKYDEISHSSVVQFLSRASVSGYKIIYDKLLDVKGYEHWEIPPSYNSLISIFEQIEIINGKAWAFNK